MILKNWITVVLVLGAAFSRGDTQQNSVGPTELRTDELKNPLGIDDPQPRFSWQLNDGNRGALQTAYQVLVASSEKKLHSGRPDVWDSGKMISGQSLNVQYGGPVLAPCTRYYWSVKTWGANDKAYGISTVNWWETALLTPEGWRASWIGYETAGEAALRNAKAEWIVNPDAVQVAAEKAPEQRYAYRQNVTLAHAVQHAELYTTAQDTVSAWVNGHPVIEAAPLPAWKQMPWKKYVRADVTGQLREGANTVAIEGVHYVVNPNGMASNEAPPMSSTLVVEYSDGSIASFANGTGWKTAIHAKEGWQKPAFDDSSWRSALGWTRPSGPTSEPLGNPWPTESVKVLRHPFELKSPVRSARLYATALGSYQLFVNGKRVGDDVLAPGWTDYRLRLKYQTYDVTDMVTDGANAIGALLAPGWYSTPLEWFQQPNNYGETPPALRAQLRIEHSDGSVEWIGTDAGWTATTSYILHSEIYDGESQDARLAQVGWNTARFAEKGWAKAMVIEPKAVPIEAQDYPSIRVERTIAAKSVNKPKPGVFVYDFGQNMAGIVRVKLQGAAGSQVTLRFAEVLNPDGTIYTDNLRTAKATDHFILSGQGIEELEPEFTFHGFRYVELTGVPSSLPLDALTAIVFHTDAPFTAKLATGSTLINQLWNNVLWGQRSNFVGVPTDCPQRDERLGWTADAQVFWRAASYNMGLAPFSRKFAGDIRGTQTGTPFYGIYAPGTIESSASSGAGWSDAGVIIPWTSWLQTGDTSAITQNWDAIEKYLGAIESANPDGLWKNQAGTPFGDWLSPEGKTDYTLVATAYWAYDVTLAQQMARALNRPADEQKYRLIFEKIRAAFQKKFVHSDGFIPGGDNSPSPFGQISNPNAHSSGGDTQTSYVLALHMNLVPEELRASAAKRLVAKIEANHGRLATGFLGTPYLLEELMKAGYQDLAYQLLLNTEYPSWGYLVDHGATTMWERWNGDQMRGDPSMNSYNHYAYGAVADWLYRYAAGIDATPLDAGFHTVVVHPFFDRRIGNLHFTYQSSYGEIRSDWTVQGSTASWNLTIPANTTGHLQVNERDSARYTLEGHPLNQSSFVHPVKGDGFDLPPGSYTFAVQLN